MTVKRRVAIMLDLEHALKRHLSVFDGTQRYAAEHPNWECTVDEFAEYALPARRTRAIPYDGIIARAPRALAQRAAALKIPLVNVWAASPAKDLPTVTPDFAAAGVLSAEHLLARGFRNFAVAYYKSRGDYVYANAFIESVRAAGFSCEQAMLPLNWNTYSSWSTTQKTIAAWIERWQKPVAVLCTDDMLGRHVVQHCKPRGIRIPLDAAIVTGMNDELFCEHPRPQLTAVEIGYERVGYEAARWLDELMAGGRPRAERLLLLPPVGIVSRESTDFFAVDDALVASALKFIGESARKPIGVNDVVKAVNASRPTLERYFRKHLQRSIGSEIRRLRIERAKRLLHDSEEPVKKIAKDSGFSNVATMTAAFRREVGMSPGKYRGQTTTRP